MRPSAHSTLLQYAIVILLALFTALLGWLQFGRGGQVQSGQRPVASPSAPATARPLPSRSIPSERYLSGDNLLRAGYRRTFQFVTGEYAWPLTEPKTGLEEAMAYDMLRSHTYRIYYKRGAPEVLASTLDQALLARMQLDNGWLVCRLVAQNDLEVQLAQLTAKRFRGDHQIALRNAAQATPGMALSTWNGAPASSVNCALAR